MKNEQNAWILHDFCPKKIVFAQIWGPAPLLPVSYAYGSTCIKSEHRSRKNSKRSFVSISWRHPKCLSFVHGDWFIAFAILSEKRTCFETECVMALQGHPRSLILTPIEKAYATSYWSSIVTLVLSCPVSEILQISWEERLHPYSARILGVFPLDQIDDVVVPRSEDPKLIIRVINFELVHPICSRYQRYGQTDGRLTIAIPR